MIGALLKSLFLLCSSLSRYSRLGICICSDVLDVVPVGTLISAVTTYYSNSLLIYGSIFAMNDASGAAS